MFWFSSLDQPVWSIPQSGMILSSFVILSTAAVSAFLIYVRYTKSLCHGTVQSLYLLLYRKSLIRQFWLHKVRVVTSLYFFSLSSVVSQAVGVSIWAHYFFTSRLIEVPLVILFLVPIFILLQFFISYWTAVCASLFILPSLIGYTYLLIWFVFLLRMNPSITQTERDSALIQFLLSNTTQFIRGIWLRSTSSKPVVCVIPYRATLKDLVDLFLCWFAVISCRR